MSNDADMFVPGEAGTIRYPVPGYAVLHERGTVLFDTGLHESLMASDAMLGPLASLFTVEMTPADLPEARLTEAGIDPASVTHVVNSHLHFDHCGHNGPFADAVTLVQATEWAAAREPATPYSYVGVPLEEIGAGDLRLVDGEVDLFGDGTVVLVPTPGHTVGHQSLLVRATPGTDADAALLVGDACYLRRMLAAGVTPRYATDVPGQLASYSTLQRFEASGVRLLFSHDIESWDAVPAGLQPTAPPTTISTS
jgi:glyoxylase-like metal-dependent hydrolase (beta-lactamase superfamily II)